MHQGSCVLFLARRLPREPGRARSRCRSPSTATASFPSRFDLQTPPLFCRHADSHCATILTQKLAFVEAAAGARVSGLSSNPLDPRSALRATRASIVSTSSRIQERASVSSDHVAIGSSDSAGPWTSLLTPACALAAAGSRSTAGGDPRPCLVHIFLDLSLSPSTVSGRRSMDERKPGGNVGKVRRR